MRKLLVALLMLMTITGCTTKEFLQIIDTMTTSTDSSADSNNQIGRKGPVTEWAIEPLDYSTISGEVVLFDDVMYIYDEFGIVNEVDTVSVKRYEDIDEAPVFLDNLGHEHQIYKAKDFEGNEYIMDDKRHVYQSTTGGYKLILDNANVYEYSVNNSGIGYTLESDNSNMFYKFFNDKSLTFGPIDSPRGVAVTDDYVWGINMDHELCAFNVHTSTLDHSFDLREMSSYYNIDTGYHWNPTYKGFQIMDSNSRYILVGDDYTQLLFDQGSMELITVCYGDNGILTEDGKIYYGSADMLVVRDIETQKDRIIASSLNPSSISVLGDDVIYWEPYDGPPDLMVNSVNDDFFNELGEQDVEFTYFLINREYENSLLVYNHEANCFRMIADSISLDVEFIDNGFKYSTSLNSEEMEWKYCYIPKNTTYTFWKEYKGIFSELK